MNFLFQCFDRAFFLACAEKQKKIIPYDKCPLCQTCIVCEEDLVVDEKLLSIITATDRAPTQKPVTQVQWVFTWAIFIRTLVPNDLRLQRGSRTVFRAMSKAFIC